MMLEPKADHHNPPHSPPRLRSARAFEGWDGLSNSRCRRLEFTFESWRRIIASLASRSAYRSLIVIDQLSKTLPRKVAFECNWHLTEQVNTEALRKWTIEPQDI